MIELGEYYLVQGWGTRGNAITYVKDMLGCNFVGSLEQGSAVGLVTKDGVLQEHSGYETLGNAFAVRDI